MRKKAQIQMGESIAIIVILLILMIFSFVFYSKFKETDIQEKKSLFEELDVVKLSQIAYALPELQCSFAEVADYGCIDILKFKYLAQIITDSFSGEGESGRKEYFYYRQLFGTSKISLQNVMDNSILELYSTNRTWISKSVVYMPVVIYNPISDTNSFGVLVVEKYA
ncbi:hypothetical protein HQ533_01380 [Candidatus Woesearchaeota archaeon]|nr:hypothetical protein [Candidatus Woesearchaeota archaeon]